ncbi:unnamed protein product [Cuscuta europaea]|uniref:Zinc knuckle CX2CX4HX4C domain-containing protein n=1 Tax=Cuscuta europaea TaxID=41803 RepID=A0A9P0Z3X4_CUSEU|nr:unnamed protein product [Cuscuta europaea]
MITILKGICTSTCVLVSIAGDVPLRRRVKLKRAGVPIWIDLKYERLQHFCFICGLMSHTDRMCPKRFAFAEEGKEEYGSWLHAGNRRGGSGRGSRWLTNEAGQFLHGSPLSSICSGGSSNMLVEEGIKISQQDVGVSTRKRKSSVDVGTVAGSSHEKTFNSQNTEVYFPKNGVAAGFGSQTRRES